MGNTFEQVREGDLVIRRGPREADVRFVEGVYREKDINTRVFPGDQISILLVNGSKDLSYDGETGIEQFNKEWRLLAESKDLKEEVIVTEKLKKRFTKDNSLPIKIFKEPYFSQKIELYDKEYGSIGKYKRFKSILRGFENDQEYLKEYNRIKEEVIEYIRSKESFKKFSNEDTSKYGVKTNISKKDIYKQTSIGKKFISIDMKKANFNSLRYYSDEIFDGCKTYEEFISKFTDIDNIIESKYIRQVIFGVLNPKRQTTYTRYLMSIVLEDIKGIIDEKEIVSFSTDEIVILEDNLTEKDILGILEIVDNSKLELTIERFKLGKILGTDGYIKKTVDGTELKCLCSLMHPIVTRKLHNEKIQDNDLVFISNQGYLSKLLEVPEIEITYERI